MSERPYWFSVYSAFPPTRSKNAAEIFASESPALKRLMSKSRLKVHIWNSVELLAVPLLPKRTRDASSFKVKVTRDLARASNSLWSLRWMNYWLQSDQISTYLEEFHLRWHCDLPVDFALMLKVGYPNQQMHFRRHECEICPHDLVTTACWTARKLR